MTDDNEQGQLGQYKNREIQERLLEGLSKLGGNITRACRFAGCSTSHYYKMLDDSDEWRAIAYRATREAKESRLDEVQDSLYQQAIGTEDKPGNVIASIFLAKTLGRSSQDPSRQYNDSPPPIEAPTEKEAPSLSDTGNTKLRALMAEFVNDVSKAEQSSKAIEGETDTTP